jgi:3-phenylpropionate/trans-cinnamate dioxygenase ferredoxin reductase component
MAGDIVIIGGGHAGVQLCAALVAAGQGARLHLVCEEPVLPYQRPPLSKSFQKNRDEALQLHRGRAWFDENGITLHESDPAVDIGLSASQVVLASGQLLPYSWLVLATGTRARGLASLPTGLTNVHVLRTAADAQQLRASWDSMAHLTVLGGGFIGLEVAATACALGKTVCVVETASRLMQRSVSVELSAHALACHRASGIEIRLDAQVGQNFGIHNERLVSLELDGRSAAVDHLLLGIGAVPEDSLARRAGLHCDNGVVVDQAMRTSAPHVLAIGDCASFPEAASGRRWRLESVQNANDQAKVAAATILGQEPAYAAVPWFWSEQGALRLQMVGLNPAAGEPHRRPGPTAASFSLLHYVNQRLVCVESVNAPADHMAARKLLEQGCSPAPAQACDPTLPLRQWISAAPTG